ncbi:endonuclease domain-containing 1 protein-like [Alosa sapidissima]|uniref:endonuclease domain-containing 1 protein-like n=1 Tax=Alosa sapidissima TaxID=34773 RepID=UPI001C09D200|nr:endonuclease domain-containing 1 protein-like [Alosa sapidissima]
MQAEKNYARDYSDAIKSKQAVNGDYSNTGYDRGQLNPSSFQCGDGRIATFTLTNSAPMDASFYTVHLKQWEECVKGILRNQSESEGTAYLVTGTVPSQDRRIPRQEEFDDVSTRDFHRVTVPTHIWTAVCYKHNVDDEKSFSFGYIGLNHPNSTINVMTVPQLNAELPALYGTSIVNIFTDDCFSNNRKSEGIIRLLYQSIQLPISETDASKNNTWDYCCNIDAYPFSALNGMTCKTDHPCDYYGYNYLWCYTTDGKWDYCCSL